MDRYGTYIMAIVGIGIWYITGKLIMLGILPLKLNTTTVRSRLLVQATTSSPPHLTNLDMRICDDIKFGSKCCS